EPAKARVVRSRRVGALPSASEGERHPSRDLTIASRTPSSFETGAFVVVEREPRANVIEPATSRLPAVVVEKRSGGGRPRGFGPPSDRVCSLPNLDGFRS